MTTHPRPRIASLALLLAGLALPAHAQDADAPLPLTPIGGIPIQVVIEVAFDVREAIAGDELYAVEGGWTHTQEGRLLRDAGWLAHHDRIEDARGTGRDVCWYDWGQPAGTPHWTVQWASELTLPEPMQRASPASGPLPPIHIAIDGTDALVIYAPPREFDYGYPGSPDDCQNPDPVPAHQRTGFIEFDLDDVDVARPPDAEDSYDEVIQDGIVLLRLPLDRLTAGTTDVAGVNLSGGDEEFAWGLRVGLTLTSEAGDF
ncbi:MAG: hypothetical protein ACNA8N_13495 [Trueperaceae bacterium]